MYFISISLNLSFLFLFGRRYEWLHQIDVTAIEDYSGKGKYPKITKKVGKSPPQYIYEDEE